ncbi:unnamed protein product [Plutella xylostella]|uniref:(diamondback moth) hypothetical protein n=1 Tax=Plutella xylostella TaxID=51655 RepID=A0A8S4D3U7_PLUXY|nr:unnamed protein product [Plutella xylostella]
MTLSPQVTRFASLGKHKLAKHEVVFTENQRVPLAHNVGSRDVKQLAQEAFNSITPETWKNCCNHVETLEKEYYERGRHMYHDIDELVPCGSTGTELKWRHWQRAIDIFISAED